MILSEPPENNSFHRDTDSIQGLISVPRTSPYEVMLIQQTSKIGVYRDRVSFQF